MELVDGRTISRKMSHDWPCVRSKENSVERK